MTGNLKIIITFFIGIIFGVIYHASYDAHTQTQVASVPEVKTEYVYIEKEPEVITETVYIEKEPTFYRELTEDDCYYLMDLAMREAEGEGTEGMLWVMYTAECRKEAFSYDSFKSVWASDAFASSWNRRGLEPNNACLEAMALFEEGWIPKPLWFRTDDYHGFGKYGSVCLDRTIPQIFVILDDLQMFAT